MATYVPPKRNTAFVFYVGLVSQADGKLLQANPTLAAGDVKVAIDDGAPANLATLPVVDADFTKRVKVSLSAAEMNGDQVTVLFADAAGAEWCDLMLNIQTVARQNDDLAFPVVSGRGVDVDATGGVEVTPNQAVNVAQWSGAAVAAPTVAGVPEVDITHVGGAAQAFPSDPADQSLVIAATDAIMSRLGVPAGASVSADIGAIEAQTDDIGVAGAGLTALGDTRLANLDATVSSRASQASVNVIDDFLDTEIAAILAAVDTEVAAIKAKTDALPASPAATGDAMALTAAAVDAISDEVYEGTLTLRQIIRIVLAAVAGKSGGFPGGPATYRDNADTKPRITATVDADGNRSAVTLDGA